MERKSCVTFSVCIAGALFHSASAITPGTGYQVQYQINNVPVIAIDRVSDSQLAAVSGFGPQDVKTVALNNGPVGPTVYTQTPLPGGTFGGGFIASDGTHAMTGQTGNTTPEGLFAGRLFLTKLSDGSTSSLDVPGNFDATQASGQYYATASAGTATGLAQNGSSGVYRVERSGDTLTGLNLILDTSAASGLVAGDSAGNLAFSLGGVSPSLSGNFNDIYRLTSAQVASAIAAGPTTGLAPSAADKLITGVALSNAASAFFAPFNPIFTSISDVIFKPDGDIIVGLSALLPDFSSVGEALLLHVTNVGGNYSASVSGTIFTNDTSGAGTFAYRASDYTLWVADGNNVYGISLVPEPSAILLLAVGIPLLTGRRTRNSGSDC